LGNHLRAAPLHATNADEKFPRRVLGVKAKKLAAIPVQGGRGNAVSGERAGVWGDKNDPKDQKRGSPRGGGLAVEEAEGGPKKGGGTAHIPREMVTGGRRSPGNEALKKKK